jgi:hypothetical protein
MNLINPFPAAAAAFEGKLNARRDDQIELFQIDAKGNPVPSFAA